jgi:hypothetical protein
MASAPKRESETYAVSLTGDRVFRAYCHLICHFPLAAIRRTIFTGHEEQTMTIDSKPHRWPVLIWLILTQIAFALSMLLWFAMAGLGLAVFSRDASFGDVLTEVLILLYPVVSIPLLVLAWRAYRQGKDLHALIFTTVPLIIGVVGYNLVTIQIT